MSLFDLEFSKCSYSRALAAVPLFGGLLGGCGGGGGGGGGGSVINNS